VGGTLDTCGSRLGWTHSFGVLNPGFTNPGLKVQRFERDEVLAYQGDYSDERHFLVCLEGQNVNSCL